MVDQRGLRASLLFCLLACAAGYAVLGAAIATPALVVLSRAAAGVFKHSQSFLRTAAARHETSDRACARRMSQMNLAGNLGFVVGPALGGAVAAKVHREVRRLGGVTPPGEFVLLDRSAIGLGSVFIHLGAKLHWHRAFEELIAGFDSGALAARQQKILQFAGVPEAV